MELIQKILVKEAKTKSWDYVPNLNLRYANGIDKSMCRYAVLSQKIDYRQCNIKKIEGIRYCKKHLKIVREKGNK